LGALTRPRSPKSRGKAARSGLLSTLELREDFGGKRLVEVDGHRELSHAQPKRPRLYGQRWNGLDLRHGSFVAQDDERFAVLNAAQAAKGIALDVLDTDGTHAMYCSAAVPACNLPPGLTQTGTRFAPY